MAKRESTVNSDWARRPSAMFAAMVLGGVSLLTMGISLSRDLQTQPSDHGSEITEVSASESAPRAQPQRPSAVRLINVNEAPLSELDLLPGIGPALGSRIIAYREEHGAFSEIGDLEKVSGIGPRTLDKLRPLITLGDAGGYTTVN
ncbi:MAG: ComEA family DNA-binding protein [Phycisphaerales bacterium]